MNKTSASSRRRKLIGFVIGLAVSMPLMHSQAWSATYPDKAVKVVVPFPPGGSSDTAARIIAKGLSDSFKQSFVVENRAGAAGTVGVAAALRSPTDGYTLGVGPVGATIIAQLIGIPVPYEAEKDIISIANIGSLPLVIAVSADVPASNLAELVAMAKAKPGALSYGTSGAGTPGHLAFEYILKLADLDIVHVPYKGDAPLTSDLMGGQLEIGVLTGPAAVAQAKGDRLKFLAVTSDARYPQLPDVPTVKEAGHDFSAEIWNLLIAPAGTDPQIIGALNDRMNSVLQQESTKETLYQQGYLQPVIRTAEETKSFVEEERVKWQTIVQTTGVKVDN